MFQKKLSSGKAVIIKEMTVDQIDECTDIPEIVFKDGNVSTIKKSSKARTQWIRYGLGGGDFKNYKEKNNVVVDDVIKQLNTTEKDELMILIQESQVLGE